jgi:hypothetical protein
VGFFQQNYTRAAFEGAFYYKLPPTRSRLTQDEIDGYALSHLFSITISLTIL